MRVSARCGWTVCWLALLTPAVVAGTAEGEAPRGYYRMPALHGDMVVFVAEGDLWRVGVAGGSARRLTSHAGREESPAISPDGRWVAFSADYEGPLEVYRMPLAGGLPERLTWHDGARVVGWTPEGAILYASRHRSTLPETQLFRLDPETRESEPLPLAQAAEGCFAPDGTLIFSRWPPIGSHVRRYRGGALQRLWTFGTGAAEAEPLFPGAVAIDRHPMCGGERVVFASERDGWMNLWSARFDGSELRQHTHHRDFDVRGPALDGGRVVYQHGADLRVIELASGTDQLLEVTLSSDLDQLRPRWIDEPEKWLTSFALSADGERVALVARGRLFVAPTGRGGRLAEVARSSDVRLRGARFAADGREVVTLSDASGEVELWAYPANGVGEPRRLSSDGEILRFDFAPSPDGRWIAHTDKNQRLFLLDRASGRSRQVAASESGDIEDLAWSPDGRFLAYARPDVNGFARIEILEASSGRATPVTSERWDSFAPAWSRDGKFLFFLSDRDLRTVVGGVWGNRQPDPFLATPTRIYGVALGRETRWPFQAPDELAPRDAEASGGEKVKETPAAARAGKSSVPAAGPTVTIDFDGLAERLHEVPVPSGRYSRLAAAEKHLFWLSREVGFEVEPALSALPIGYERPKISTLLSGVGAFELSADGKRLGVRKGDALYVFDAGAKAPEPLADAAVDLTGWRFELDPLQELAQMYREGWRLLRDYFWDPGLRGLEWSELLEKYRPAAERLTHRAELSDLLTQLTAELSTLHHFVSPGDVREGRDQIDLAFLGGRFARDVAAGGHRLVEIYRGDPEVPGELAPIARPRSRLAPGETVVSVDGVAALPAADLGALLRGKAGRQVLLRVRAAAGGEREVVVEPIDGAAERRLRYSHWQLGRRDRVEQLSEGRIGYLHLSAMGGSNFEEFARAFYPVAQRQGLVVDVRHNNGGNIDSWILGKLARQAWAYWQGRVGRPYWNQQQAFRGHMVVVVDQATFSDGELFAEGFRRLGLGPVVGARTQGGEVWLTASNHLVDRGIATAAEFGVYGPEGAWLIEGHGVEPDLEVDNLPHATFRGDDAQLEAAVRRLLERIAEDPRPVPPPPSYPGPPPVTP